MINLDNLQPDWEFAEKHGQASLIGYTANEKPNKNNSQVCPCCLQYLFKQPIPLLVNSKQLQFLGFGFPLFYSFVKNCIILTIILICSYSSISLKKAIDYNYQFCHPFESSNVARALLASTQDIYCTSFMVQMSRIQSQVSSEQVILRIASFIVQILFLVYMRDHITKLESYYDERNTSLSDYSVLLRNIPKQKYTQNKLNQFFGNAFKKKYQIKQITLIPEYVQIQQLKKQRESIIEKLRKAHQKVQFSQEDHKQQSNLQKVDMAIFQQIMQSSYLAQKDELECQKAILVFNTDQQKQQIIQEFKFMDFSLRGPYFGLGAEQMKISESPEPKQILWQNINVGTKRRLGLILFSWGLSLFVLVCVTVVFYFILDLKSQNLQEAYKLLKKDKNNQKYKTNYNLAVALVYFLLIIVVLFNKLIMSSLFQKFTAIQKNQTRSKFQFSFALKYLIGIFFTTALMTLAVQAITLNNYFTHAYGVIQQQTIMFLLNAFFTPLYWIINPFHLARKLRRWLNKGKKNFTQKQANTLMQQSHYDMGKRYAEIIQTVWFTFLYSTLIPIGAFISLVGLFLYYWADKYTLLRRSSIGGQVSGKLVIKSLKLLDLTLVLKPARQILFDMQVHHDHIPIQSIIMLVIGFLYFILPSSKIITIINPEMFHLEEKTYQQVKQKFKDTYHTQHPIYKIIHAEKLKGQLSSKGISFQNYINQSPLNRTQADLIDKSAGSSSRPTKKFQVKPYFQKRSASSKKSQSQRKQISNNVVKGFQEQKQ